MNIAILGYAGQGHSAYEYWKRDGNHITICDQDISVTLPTDVEQQLGPDYLKDLDRFDLLVRTPALHPRDIQAANYDNPHILDKVTTVTNEFMAVCPTKNIIGVTGTKGKGTTSTLIAAMLKTAGKRVHLGGNIGIPPLELLKHDITPDDWVVLELANFQLIDLKISPGIGVCLMIEPEHLNWHDDIDEYLEAKRQLFAHQPEDSLAIYYAPNKYSLSLAQATAGVLIPFMAPPGAEVVGDTDVVIGKTHLCKTSEIKLLGKHNWQNICAAATVVWQIAPDAHAIHQTIVSFLGLPHRLEVVREIDGVRYYNDSFASAPGATIAAMDAVEGPKVMIVGGFDRGLDLGELARGCVTHQESLRKVLLVGSSGSRIEAELKAHGFMNYELLHYKNIEQIVERARELAQQGDNVVLSPGFASFDMFKNFEDRGIKYKEYVNSMP